LAEQIEKKFGIQPRLIRSHGGVFEVTVGNDLIFSKKKTGRFPEPGEVETALEQRANA
jgi:selT/selW/selH-like putative selenoprotein